MDLDATEWAVKPAGTWNQVNHAEANSKSAVDAPLPQPSNCVHDGRRSRGPTLCPATRPSSCFCMSLLRSISSCKPCWRSSLLCCRADRARRRVPHSPSLASSLCLSFNPSSRAASSAARRANRSSQGGWRSGLGDAIVHHGVAGV